MTTWSHLSHFYTLEAHTKEKKKKEKKTTTTHKKRIRVTQPLTNDEMVTSQQFLHT